MRALTLSQLPSAGLHVVLPEVWPILQTGPRAAPVCFLGALLTGSGPR